MSQQGKRKRQDKDEQEAWLSDKRLKLITLDEEDRKPPRQSLAPKATEASQTSISPEASEVAFMDLTADDDMLPELTHEISSLSPGSEETHSLDGFSQDENPLPTSLLPGSELDQDKVQVLADDALFSEFLRSPSPSLSQTGADYGKDDLQTSMTPQTIVPANVCLSPERDPHLADLAAECVPDVKHKNIQTKKPCVTLHVRSTKPASKRKVSLRLNPPKKAPKRAPKPKSIRPGPKNREKRA
ncbi:hypothetical protein MMC28_007184 [Mycoblastus sanguinarius]|nr:hypothetical protein [Mycoblastus sanguinarius]